MNAPDNPAAFPWLVVESATNGGSGMTLRDWFAGQALAGFLAESLHDCGPEGIAHDCYLYADAMLAERAKGGAA